MDELVCSACGQARYRLDVPVGHSDFGRVFCACAAPPDPDERYRRRLKVSGLTDLESGYALTGVYAKPGRRKAQDAAQKVLEQFGWLTLHGNYGAGKSYLGCALVNEALRRDHTAVYHVMPLFLEELRRAFAPNVAEPSSALYQRALEAEVLVVDEFDRFYATEWARERFTLLFLERYRASSRTVTVWISNLEPQVGNGASINRPELDAFFSRMTEFPIVEMSDGDIRPALGKRK